MENPNTQSPIVVRVSDSMAGFNYSDAGKIEILEDIDARLFGFPPPSQTTSPGLCVTMPDGFSDGFDESSKRLTDRMVRAMGIIVRLSASL